MREVIARIVDGSRFHEYQPAYGTTLVCGFAHIWGYKVGILANNGVLFNDSSLKGAHFMELCNRNRTPLVFLQNITGYMVGREYEAARHHQGRRQDDHGADRQSTVPKFTVIVNGSFGAGNYGMCGRAFDRPLPVHVAAATRSRVMGGEQAANTLAEVKVRQLEREGRTLAAARDRRNPRADARGATAPTVERLLLAPRSSGTTASSIRSTRATRSASPSPARSTRRSASRATACSGFRGPT